ncbi:glycine zipper 2TM domain-containing protein [Noviherbaspirillum pedocola]|uniref:Glycine zipper 2TM domain-containing protein n=1 Tax=Noviherbaspirillum pedocola TaxID=2801341 RepID=A0A934SSF8_9BURK|nr:glycine zipper 2TM domain-containing protein [Noviherbaspirillum pedocola]MBK4735916.1 glycine zipper 2TM domain-containing protein [Noviherbaspirillum pedocola]
MMIRALSLIAVLTFPVVASATEYRIVERPRQECWNEQVPVQRVGNDYGGVVLGGLAGGILGNQVGGGNGRAVATAIGAVTGALVGDQVANNSGPGYRSVQRCRTVMDQVREPVYQAPAPVYTAPAPVYVRPAPVYVQAPPAIIEQPGYYVAPAQPVYYGDRWDHRWHHRHHRDDDDD